MATQPDTLQAEIARRTAVLVLIIVIAAAGACGGGGDSDGGNDQPQEVVAQETVAEANGENEEQPAPEPTATSEPEIERIVQAVPGAVAEADDVRVTLNEIVDPWISDNPFFGASPGNRKVAFDVTIQVPQIGEKPIRFRCARGENALAALKKSLQLAFGARAKPFKDLKFIEFTVKLRRLETSLD